MLPPLFVFFNDTATTEIYTLSLHDALPIYRVVGRRHADVGAAGDLPVVVHRDRGAPAPVGRAPHRRGDLGRSEEHTSEPQSRPYLGCRLLLGKNKITESRVPCSCWLRAAVA